MAIIPLKQTISIVRGGGLDDWGNPLPGVTIKHKCRVDEGSHIVTSHTGNGTLSAGTVVADARILLDKLVDVRYDDVVSYENEIGLTLERNPKKIDVKRDLTGKPLFTEVYV